MTISFANAQLNSVAIVGDGAGGWPSGGADTHQMFSSDGVNWSINNLTLLNGAVKFRGNNSWALPYNWGGATFPSGTAVVDANAMTSISGVYNITFNSTTRIYNFILQASTFPVIGLIGEASPGGWSSDTDMTTTDGINYTINRVSLVPGSIKFRQDHSWTTNWGGITFASGTGVVDGDAITVPTAGKYNVTFNLNTLSYTFAFPSVAIVGSGAGGWPNDPQIDGNQMTTTNGIDYSLNDILLTSGNAKFRANNSWAINWGASNFPNGTATLNSASSFLCVAGTYNVTFDYDTEVYNFILQTPTFPIIGLIGNATPGEWTTDTDMTTTDGVNYTINRVSLVPGAIKFRQDHSWTTNWGGIAFASGTGVVDGAAITVPTAGKYNVTFNTTTLSYTFAFPSVAIVGSGAGGWPNDPQIDANQMTTSNGIDYAINNILLTSSDAKFRANNSWAINWGATNFPNGTAILDSSSSFSCLTGTYNATFNYDTGDYSFSSNFSVISLNNGGVDIDMSTLDGENYFLNNYVFTAGSYKFRQGNANALVWGGSTFPNGTSQTSIGRSIIVPGKSFNVTFNKTTGAYTFSFVAIGLVGNATSGGWTTDTFMSTSNGVNYSLNGVSLTNAFVKFRQGMNWTTNWGSISFPSGTANENGSDIVVNESSDYNITFNIQTREYNFKDILKSKIRDIQCGSILTTLNQAIKAVIIPSAQMYRFEVTNGTSVRTFENSIAVFSLTNLTGSTYGTAYSVRVAVKISGAWKPYGTSCDVYSPSIISSSNVPTTKIRASQCGTTLAGLGSPIHSELVYGAEAYRFEITNGSAVSTFESPIYYFFLTDTAVATYGTSYSIKTAAKIAGVWGNYGLSCSISTPVLSANTVPTTQISSAFCGSILATLNTKIGANTVFNANGYRFKIISAGVTTTYVSSLYNFRLSDAGIVATSGTTYAISVAARVNGIFGNYGASCNITTPEAISPSSRQIVENVNFNIVAYPNPSSSSFNLQIAGSVIGKLTEVMVFDMNGKLIEQHQVQPSENIELGGNYSSGIYNIIVTQDHVVKTLKVIKK